VKKFLAVPNFPFAICLTLSILIMGQIKPFHILLFLLSVFASLGGIAYIFPEGGLYIPETKLSFPTLSSYFNAVKPQKKDISDIIALADAEDKLTAKDTLPKTIKQDSAAKKEIKYLEVKDASIKLITSLQYRDSMKTSLDNFFQSLAEVQNGEKGIRVLHYGDSQIEGDRITDYLRQKLQGHFGGSGPGLIAAMPVAQSVGLWQSWSDNWDRYTFFASKDKRVAHTNYGISAGFCRFNEYKDTVSVKNAWIKVKTTKSAGPLFAAYTKVKLFYASQGKKTKVQFLENGELKRTDTLAANGSFNIAQFNMAQAPTNFEMKFEGKDSPDIYGLSLEGNGGVMVDNFGLRGSSGTFFNQMNLQHLKLFYDHLNTKLIILQFGGNALPYIKDKKMCYDFGSYLRAQISSLKKLLPGISILVIGPSDMSVKDGESYVTHPQLENLRDAIRLAAFETNSAFFDMYDCMGGRNSMVSWVEQNIAATDYIHFSPAGARKIAVLLYSALMNDYNNFIQKKNKKGV
jgi:lysophospholipase L1-like esterase